MNRNDSKASLDLAAREFQRAPPFSIDSKTSRRQHAGQPSLPSLANMKGGYDPDQFTNGITNAKSKTSGTSQDYSASLPNVRRMP